MKMKNSTNGFTLIEVLIAMTILAIALSAVLYTERKNIANVIYLKNKSVAHWVALNIQNQLKTNLISLAQSDNELKNKTTMLGNTWFWKVTSEPTKNPNIMQITISVSQKENTLPIEILHSYLLKKQRDDEKR